MATLAHRPPMPSVSVSRPPLRLVGVAATPRVPRAVHRRRRVAAVALAVVVLLVAKAAPGWVGGGPGPEAGPTPRHRPPSHAHVVAPGDTLWGIARALQPEGDVRPLVDRLARARQGRPLQAGERVSVR